MRRRGFLAVLAGLPLAGKLIARETAPTTTATEIALRNAEAKVRLQERMVALNPMRYRYMTVRTGLPPLAWRKLNEEDVKSAVNKRNELLAQMPWRE